MYHINFKTKSGEKRSGYFKEFGNAGFITTTNLDMAAKFETLKEAQYTLSELIEKQGKWYEFNIF